MNFRPLNLAFVALAMIVVSACQQAPPPSATWSGVSVVDGQSFTVTLEVRNDQDRWEGNYWVDAVHGTFTGTLDGDTLEAELSPSATCTFWFTGMVSGDSLEGEFTPRDCPEGDGGTWSLVRQ